MSIDFSNANIRQHMLEGKFGLEKESLRVTTKGFLAHTKHPFVNNPNIERDFCENQVEIITDVSDSVEQAWEQLAKFQKHVVDTLQHQKSGKELLWPFSNPPYVLGESDIPIASYQAKFHGKRLYREYLATKYGKKKMLFSGIHFNFSFSEAFLTAAYSQSEFSTMREFKDRIYLELAKKVTIYSWLIVYLTAASPVMDGSFFSEKEIGKSVEKDLASPRCSNIGYWNDFDIILQYDSLQSYIESIESYVENGQLKEPAELYYPVRLKPAGENTLERLKENGVNHIELRMLDLNPLESVGICKKYLHFLHLFLIYLLSLEDEVFWPFEQVMAIKNEKNAAKYDDKKIWIETGWNSSMPIRHAALQVLSSLERFYAGLGEFQLVKIIQEQEQKVLFPEMRYAVQVKSLFQDNYVRRGIALAEEYAKQLGETI